MTRCQWDQQKHGGFVRFVDVRSLFKLTKAFASSFCLEVNVRVHHWTPCGDGVTTGAAGLFNQNMLRNCTLLLKGVSNHISTTETKLEGSEISGLFIGFD